MLTVIYTMDTGGMTKHMATVNTLTQMEQSTKAIGSTTSSTDKAKKNGLMGRSMKETTNSAKKTGLESSYGLTDPSTKVNSSTTISMVMESISGPTAENSQATGSAIRCKEKVYSHGMMEDAIREITLMIKNTVMVFLLGLTAGSMMANGKTASKTELASTTMSRVTLDMVNGPTAKDYAGSQKQNTNKRTIKIETATN